MSSVNVDIAKEFEKAKAENKRLTLLYKQARRVAMRLERRINANHRKIDLLGSKLGSMG